MKHKPGSKNILRYTEQQNTFRQQLFPVWKANVWQTAWKASLSTEINHNAKDSIWVMLSGKRKISDITRYLNHNTLILAVRPFNLNDEWLVFVSKGKSYTEINDTFWNCMCDVSYSKDVGGALSPGIISLCNMFWEDFIYDMGEKETGNKGEHRFSSQTSQVVCIQTNANVALFWLLSYKYWRQNGNIILFILKIRILHQNSILNSLNKFLSC